MANAYIGSLIEFDRSILRYPERWSKVQEQLAAGENVIMLGNHQSEGDAGESILICIWSLYAQLD